MTTLTFGSAVEVADVSFGAGGMGDEPPAGPHDQDTSGIVSVVSPSSPARTRSASSTGRGMASRRASGTIDAMQRRRSLGRPSMDSARSLMALFISSLADRGEF